MHWYCSYPDGWVSYVLLLFTVVCEQLPKLMELVGLGYTSWFIYRYLLFKVGCSLTAVCKLQRDPAWRPGWCSGRLSIFMQ